MKNNALAYSLKVWLTAVFLGSLILTIFLNWPSFAERVSYVKQVTTVGIVITLISCVFSVPSLIILLLSSWSLCNVSISNVNRKLILTGIGGLSGLLAFYVANLNHVLRLSDLGLIFPYVVVVIAGTWFYKLKTEKEEIDPEVSS